MFMQATITVGCGEDRDCKPLSREEEAFATESAMRILSLHFGGVTILKGDGAWLDDNDTLIVEPCRHFLVMGDKVTPELVGQAAVSLRNLFNQSCVVVSISNSAITLV